MAKKVIFYHIYMFGNYQAMVTEQLTKLIDAGLFASCDKLCIGVTRPNSDRPKKKLPGQRYTDRRMHPPTSPAIKVILPAAMVNSPKIEVRYYPQNAEELETLKWIKSYADANRGDYVMYFHTKGITKQCVATEDWRRYMEYFVVERWRDCILKLDEGNDCCGVLWNIKVSLDGTGKNIDNLPHFSGGMWWATTKYINTLNHSYLDNPVRFYREFWIGSGAKVKCHEFHNSGMNDISHLVTGVRTHYNTRYRRINYVPLKVNGHTVKLHIFCASYQLIPELEMLINSFIVQTYSEWILHIWHDGKAPDQLRRMVSRYTADKRIQFLETSERTNTYGHINRKRFLEVTDAHDDDYILMTNHDNYYVPTFIELMLDQCNDNVGMVYCDTLHSYNDYEVLKSQVRVCYIDMGSFIVKASVAKAVGFNGINHSADGAYAVACAKECARRKLSIVYIPKALFVHN